MLGEKKQHPVNGGHEHGDYWNHDVYNVEPSVVDVRRHTIPKELDSVGHSPIVEGKQPVGKVETSFVQVRCRIQKLIVKYLVYVLFFVYLLIISCLTLTQADNGYVIGYHEAANDNQTAQFSFFYQDTAKYAQPNW